MIFVEVEAERAESSIHTVQTVHITFTAVGIGMVLALNEEACLKERTQPGRPLTLLLLFLLNFVFHWPPSSLQFMKHRVSKTRSNHRIQEKQRNVVLQINQSINQRISQSSHHDSSVLELHFYSQFRSICRERKRLSFLERERERGKWWRKKVGRRAL